MNKKNLTALLTAVAFLVLYTSCAQPEDDGYRSGEEAALSQPETSEAEQRTESPEAQPETELPEPDPNWTVTEIGKTPWFILEVTDDAVDVRSPLENWYLPDALSGEVSHQLYFATSMQDGMVTGYVDSSRGLGFRFDYLYSIEEGTVVVVGNRIASFENGSYAILSLASPLEMQICRADGEILYTPPYEEDEVWTDFVLLNGDFTLADRQLPELTLELTNQQVISGAFYHESSETYVLVYDVYRTDQIELYLFDKQDNLTVIPLEKVEYEGQAISKPFTFYQTERFLYLFDEYRRSIYSLDLETWEAELVEDPRRQEVASAFPDIEWMGEWYLPSIPIPPFFIEPKKDSELVLVVDTASGDILYEMEDYYYLISWEECEGGYRALFQCSYDLPVPAHNMDISNQSWDFRSWINEGQ